MFLFNYVPIETTASFKSQHIVLQLIKEYTFWYFILTNAKLQIIFDIIF